MMWWCWWTGRERSVQLRSVLAVYGRTRVKARRLCLARRMLKRRLTRTHAPLVGPAPIASDRSELLQESQ